MNLLDVSRLLEAYKELYTACMWIDHGHPPRSLYPALSKIQELEKEIKERSNA